MSDKKAWNQAPMQLEGTRTVLLDEYACQRQLIEALGISDEHEINQQQDSGRRLRMLARLNEAKACLKRHVYSAGTNGKAVALAVAELTGGIA